MTPGYASPEQMRGEALTPASDVSSLGVILYQLFTGTQPFPARDLSGSEVLHAITTQTPLPPSVAVRQLPKPVEGQVISPETLKGDLDDIVLRALQRKPQRRYTSVS